MARWTSLAIVGLAWLLILAAFVLPTAAILGTCVADGMAPQGGFTLSSRQIGLLTRTVLMAACATVLSVLISIPAVIVQAGRAGRSTGFDLLIFSALVLLTPPMVYAFGWERITPDAFGPYARCIGVWSLWGWPVAAVVIGAGWSSSGKSAYEHALLSTTPLSAFARVGFPAIRAHFGLAAAILFVVFFNDYGTPHACGLMVYGVELLGWAAASYQAIDTFWPAIPSVVVTLIMLAVAVRWIRSASPWIEDGTRRATHAPPSACWRWGAILVFGVAWIVPIGGLMKNLTSPSYLFEALRVYGSDLVWSLCVAAGSAALAIVVGIGLRLGGAGFRVVAVWSVAFGLLPAAIVGRSLIAAYNQPFTAVLYDHWPILVLAYLARFAWIGILAACVIVRSTPGELIDQAKADGATPWQLWLHVRLGWHWPTALAAAAIIAAQSVAEAAASTLVRTPDYSPIAHVIIEKFHRFESDMLISLCFWLVAIAIPGAILCGLAARRIRHA